jgi:hypothetical protein
VSGNTLALVDSKRTHDDAGIKIRGGKAKRHKASVKMDIRSCVLSNYSASDLVWVCITGLGLEIHLGTSWVMHEECA